MRGNVFRYPGDMFFAIQGNEWGVGSGPGEELVDDIRVAILADDAVAEKT